MIDYQMYKTKNRLKLKFKRLLFRCFLMLLKAKFAIIVLSF